MEDLDLRVECWTQTLRKDGRFKAFDGFGFKGECSADGSESKRREREREREGRREGARDGEREGKIERERDVVREKRGRK